MTVTVFHDSDCLSMQQSKCLDNDAKMPDAHIAQSTHLSSGTTSLLESLAYQHQAVHLYMGKASL